MDFVFDCSFHEAKGIDVLQFRACAKRIITGRPEAASLSSEIKVFPNPTSGRFQVNGSFDKIQVYDLTGREIRIPVYSDQTWEMDLSSVRNGIYLLYIYRANEIQVEK